MTGGPRGDHAVQPPRLDHSTIGQKPTISRDVHYVGSYGECIAAKVTAVPDPLQELVDLTAFPPRQEPLFGLIVIRHDEEKSTGSWHWPERA